MTTFPARAVVAVCLVAGFMAGCSGDRNGIGSAQPRASTPSTIDPSSAGTGNPLASPSATGPRGSQRPGSPEPAVKECRGRRVDSRRRGEPGGTYITAAPTVQNGWGPTCMLLDAGDRCTIRWNGAYAIVSDTSGFVEFQVWTDTGRSPAHTQQIGPVPDQGQFRRWQFPVTIPRAKEIALQMILMDSHKVPIAISDAFVYPVGCPGAEG